jgi:large conductance mechanosensitive channel
MSLVKEFKEFALKGNVVDLAVGVIIGGAFGKIVSSLVSDVIMPPLGVLLGGVNFSDIKIMLKDAAVDMSGKAIPAVSINIGAFIQTVIDFAIIAGAIFIMIKMMNTLRRKKDEEPAAPPEKPEDVKLLEEIRDLMKNK